MGHIAVDFDKTARDYAAYRGEFPEELFTRLAAMGVGVPGQRVLDLGTGTGTLGRRLARAGCTVTGVDPAARLLAEARRLDTEAGVDITYQIGRAEQTGLPTASWDVVTAGQCWPWFEQPRTAQEIRRLLVPGGALVLCNRDYLRLPGNVCAATEDLVLRCNPGWRMPPGTGIYPSWTLDVAGAGFTRLETFSFDLVIPHSHAAWRGRMRTCNGVGPSLSDDAVAEFDAALARLLAVHFPEEPLPIPHRVWALVAHSPDA